MNALTAAEATKVNSKPFIPSRKRARLTSYLEPLKRPPCHAITAIETSHNILLATKRFTLDFADQKHT